MGLEDVTQWMQEVKVLIRRLEQLPRTSKGPGKPATCVLAWDLPVSLYPPLRKMVAGEDYYAKPPRPIPSTSPHRPFWLGLEKEVIVYFIIQYNPIIIKYDFIKVLKYQNQVKGF
jgi:hypothetical protein